MAPPPGHCWRLPSSGRYPDLNVCHARIFPIMKKLNSGFFFVLGGFVLPNSTAGKPRPTRRGRPRFWKLRYNVFGAVPRGRREELTTICRSLRIACNFRQASQLSRFVGLPTSVVRSPDLEPRSRSGVTELWGDQVAQMTCFVTIIGRIRSLYRQGRGDVGEGHGHFMTATARAL